MAWKEGHSNPQGLWIANAEETEHKSSEGEVRTLVRARAGAVGKTCGRVCGCARRSKRLRLANIRHEAKCGGQTPKAWNPPKPCL